VLAITLVRPPVNVLDLATLRALTAAVESAAAGPAPRVVLLRSALDGVFSAGMDVADHAPERAPEMLEAAHRLLAAIDALPHSTVAVVDGRCRGGAVELLLVCEAVFATPRSDFAFPEVDVGCFPPAAAALLPSRVGMAAAELILTGIPLSAAEAERLGLVTRVADDAEAAARDYAQRVASKSAAVVALARRAMREAGGPGLSERLQRAEAIYRQELLRTEDAAEGVRAFLQKRKPSWRHR
jgi:cyclohexa-1,5-dienecarbonyl-CoA hydratase